MRSSAHRSTVVDAGSRGRRLWLGLCALLLLAATTTAHAADSRTLRHPGSESNSDRRGDYPTAVLRLALQRAGLPYRLQPVATRMPQSRSLRLLERGELDVVWTTPDPERLRRLRAVPLAIDGGLIGWRLLMIRRDSAGRFAAIRAPPDLAGFRFAQGHDWPDVAILRANGLRVTANPSYDGLFAMLAHGHTDIVPRGLSEVDGELRAQSRLQLAVEPRIVLHYPNGLFFFVGRDDAALAEALERGLRLASTDGSLRRLFETYYGTAVDRARLDERRVLTLRNPTLPGPLAATLWFDREPAR